MQVHGKELTGTRGWVSCIPIPQVFLEKPFWRHLLPNWWMEDWFLSCFFPFVHPVILLDVSFNIFLINVEVFFFACLTAEAASIALGWNGNWFQTLVFALAC